jgi:hypothetical protein
MNEIFVSVHKQQSVNQSIILFGEEDDLEMFNEAYETIKFHLRRG